MNTPPAEQPEEQPDDDRLDRELAALLDEYPDLKQAEPHPAARPEPEPEVAETKPEAVEPERPTAAPAPVVEKTEKVPAPAEAPEVDGDQDAEPDTPGLSPKALRGLIGAAVFGGLVVAGIGFYLSFKTVAQVAHTKGGFSVDDARLVPIGVDAGILVFLALDLVLAYKRMPLPWLRLIAHALTFATVWFNASGGDGKFDSITADPLKATMHGAMPLLFVGAVEAARHWVVRLAAIEAGADLGRLGIIRWLLAPVPTFFLWRRSKLWQIPVAEAVALEKERLTFKAQLDQRYPDGIPGEAKLRLQLARRYGQSLTEDLPDVEQLLTALAEGEQDAVAASGNETPAPSGKPSGTGPGNASGNRSGKASGNASGNRSGKASGNASGNRSGKAPVTGSGKAPVTGSGKAPVTGSGKTPAKRPGNASGNAPSAETREAIRDRIRALLADGTDVPHAELARDFGLDPKTGPDYVRNQFRAVQRAAEKKGTP